MRIVSELVGGENDHKSGYPMDNRGFALLMAMVVIATTAFGIIMHGAVLEDSCWMVSESNNSFCQTNLSRRYQ
jgi:hypothetical protein